MSEIHEAKENATTETWDRSVKACTDSAEVTANSGALIADTQCSANWLTANSWTMLIERIGGQCTDGNVY